MADKIGGPALQANKADNAANSTPAVNNLVKNFVSNKTLGAAAPTANQVKQTLSTPTGAQTPAQLRPHLSSAGPGLP